MQDAAPIPYPPSTLSIFPYDLTYPLYCTVFGTFRCAWGHRKFVWANLCCLQEMEWRSQGYTRMCCNVSIPWTILSVHFVQSVQCLSVLHIRLMLRLVGENHGNDSVLGLGCHLKHLSFEESLGNGLLIHSCRNILHTVLDPPPPPGCPNTGQILVQGAKVRKHGVAVFGQARGIAQHVPRNLCSQVQIHTQRLQ